MNARISARHSLLAGMLALAPLALAAPSSSEPQRDLSRLLTEAHQHPSQAIQQLEQQLAADPHWHRARLELARLYYRQQQYPAARQAVKQVVSNTELPATVRKNVLTFYRKILQAEQAQQTHQASVDYAQHWQLGGQLSLASGYDSNANTGPEHQDIGLRTLRLKPGALQRSDHYLSSQLLLRAGRSLSAADIAPGTAGHLRWRNRLHLSKRQYQQQRRADIRTLQLVSSLHYQLDAQWQLSGELQLSHLTEGRNSDINYAGLKPTLQWQQGPHQVRLSALHKDRNYLASRARAKDGPVQELALRYSFQPGRQWRLQLGGRLIDTDYQGQRHSYHAREADARLNYRYSAQLALWSQLRYRSSHYQAAEAPLYPDARDENNLSLRAGARYRLSEDLSLGLTLSSYRNQANHKLHDYNRQLAELRLNWQF